MKRHLSSGEFSRRIAGERAPECERHVEECAECRAELATLDSTLLAFRGSVTEWSRGIEPSARLMNYRASAAPRRSALPWMLAVAALLVLLISVPLYRASRAREARRIAATAATAASDALLLEQVDAEISRAVPEPMEPLVQLVSWGPGPADAKNNGKTQ